MKGNRLVKKTPEALVNDLKKMNGGTYPKVLGANIDFTVEYWVESQTEIKRYYENLKSKKEPSK